VHDASLVGGRGVVAVGVGLDSGGRRHLRAHAVPPALEGLREGVQRRRRALAADHLPERHGDAGEVRLDQVQGLGAELGLDRRQAYRLVLGCG